MEEEINNIVEKSIDYAFDGKFVLNMYDYLKSLKATKATVDKFIDSTTASEINFLVLDLEDYLEGGSDNEHKQLREGYGYLSKPEARKIKNYLQSFLDDAVRYKDERKPGRRKKVSK